MTLLPQQNKPVFKPINKSLPFIDLKAQQEKIRPRVEEAIKRVLDHGKYIMGPEVFELEAKLSEFTGAKHVITCSSGTDALTLALLTKNVGPGDAVFVPSFTFAATAEVVCLRGATPIFIDSLPDTYNIDPQSLKIGIERAKKQNLRTVGIIAVDLFGQPADYDALQAIVDSHSLWMIADAAQSFGATYKGRKVGTLAEITTTSFFPAKPFGCYGDGGALFTNNDAIADLLKSFRVHGKGAHKYDNARIGLNARLDTIQATILLEKLKIFPQELKVRDQVAKIYNQELKNMVRVPIVLDSVSSSWAQYTVVLPEKLNRKNLISSLKEQGIPTVIYYEKSLHLQKAYNQYSKASNLEVCENLSNQVLSFPMHGYLSEEDAYAITQNVRYYV
jgi:dTDP-4-amino-4,6-dideoxygalactose transaminase